MERPRQILIKEVWWVISCRARSFYLLDLYWGKEFYCVLNRAYYHGKCIKVNMKWLMPYIY